MRRSPKRHALAVLRTFLGLTQKEMADLAKCSVPTIQAIELGKLRLTEDRASIIQMQTGVGYRWLMGGDPTARIQKAFDLPYTERDFELTRAAHGGFFDHPYALENIRAELALGCWRLAKLIVAACEKDDYYRCIYLIEEALKKLEKEFKVAKSAGANQVKLGVGEKDSGIPGHTPTQPNFTIIEQTALKELKRLMAAKRPSAKKRR